MRKKVSTTVYLTEETAARLKALNAATKVPAAVFVREAIDAQLAAWEAVVASGGQITFSASAVESGAEPVNPS